MDFCVLIEIFVKNCYDVKKLFKNKKKRGFEMLSIIKSAALLGIDSYPVEVEVDLSNGLPAFDIVGLPDSAVKESRERVRTAIRNAGFSFPVKRITVNLAPADTKKEGAAFDLPIALGILSACNLFSAEKTEDALITGELSLDGSVRPVNGVLPMLYDALRRSDFHGTFGVFLPLYMRKIQIRYIRLGKGKGITFLMIGCNLRAARKVCDNLLHGMNGIDCHSFYQSRFFCIFTGNI